MQFREHRGGSTESMKTAEELPDRAALVAHCQKLLAPYSFTFEPSALKVQSYGKGVYIVTIDGYGVVGFTDTPC